LQSVEAILGPEASAALRDRLIAQLNDIGSNDNAAMWAHRSIGEKNRLTAADAQRVEEIFQAKVAIFATEAEGVLTTAEPVRPLAATRNRNIGKLKSRERPKAIDKTALPVPEHDAFVTGTMSNSLPNTRF
jgi:hypothetical protein